MLRTVARWTVPTLAALAALATLGCTATEDATEPPPDRTEPPATTPMADFCVRFPLRDAGVLFAAPNDPGLAGDPTAIHQLLEIGADGVDATAPAEIRPSVDTYVAALRRYQVGTDPLADPATRASVATINAWLAEHCPPPGTTP